MKNTVKALIGLAGSIIWLIIIVVGLVLLFT